MMIDTHAHLCDPCYNGALGIIGGMAGDALKAILTVSYDLQSCKVNLELAEKHKNIFAAVGVHPSNCYDLPENYLGELERLAGRDRVAALGEIGLDYHYDDTDKIKQADALVAQLDLAERTGLPVIFHVRDAYEDMLSVLKPRYKSLKAGGVMHCFSGSKEIAKIFVDMGFYISFSGSVTFKNAVKFPEIVRSLPRDRILAETDCPYLAPHPYRGKTNYPAYVHLTAARLAEILEVDKEEIERITTENALSLFPVIKKGLSK